MFGRRQRIEAWTLSRQSRINAIGTDHVSMGMEILKTIQELLGHTEIQTTMRYVNFSPEHAAKAVRAAQQREQLTAAEAAANK